MRIVGGRFRRRILSAPKSQAIRPTADRLREALFNILTHSYEDAPNGARVLGVADRPVIDEGVRDWRGVGARAGVGERRRIRAADAGIVAPRALDALQAARADEAGRAFGVGEVVRAGSAHRRRRIIRAVELPA